MMEELNLDNMQDDSGVSTNKSTGEVTHSMPPLDMNSTEEINDPSFYQQDLDSMLKGEERLNTSEHEHFLDDNSSADRARDKPKRLAVDSKPVIEMEAITEFTEFGVPITIMQVNDRL